MLRLRQLLYRSIRVWRASPAARRAGPITYTTSFYVRKVPLFAMLSSIATASRFLHVLTLSADAYLHCTIAQNLMISAGVLTNRRRIIECCKDC